MTVEQDPKGAQVTAQALVDKVKQLIHEGNVRRVIIKNDKGATVMEVPVTAGVVAAIAAPVLTAIAAIAALSNEWTIVVERRDEPPAPKSPEPNPD